MKFKVGDKVYIRENSTFGSADIATFIKSYEVVDETTIFFDYSIRSEDKEDKKIYLVDEHEIISENEFLLKNRLGLWNL